MENYDKVKNYYLNSWRTVLVSIANWDQNATELWLNEATQTFELDDSCSWVYHKPPAYWVVGTIITKRFGETLHDKDYLSVEGAVLTALDFGTPNFSEPKDWRNYRVQLNEKFERFTLELNMSPTIMARVLQETPTTLRQSNIHAAPVELTTAREPILNVSPINNIQSSYQLIDKGSKVEFVFGAASANAQVTQVRALNPHSAHQYPRFIQEPQYA